MSQGGKTERYHNTVKGRIYLDNESTKKGRNFQYMKGYKKNLEIDTKRKFREFQQFKFKF